MLSASIGRGLEISHYPFPRHVPHFSPPIDIDGEILMVNVDGSIYGWSCAAAEHLGRQAERPRFIDGLGTRDGRCSPLHASVARLREAVRFTCSYRDFRDGM